MSKPVCPNCRSSKNVSEKETGFFNHTYRCSACSKNFEGAGYIQPIGKTLGIVASAIAIIAGVDTVGTHHHWFNNDNN